MPDAYIHDNKHKSTEVLCSDPVNLPSHYRQFGKEVIDIIRDTLTPEEFVGYCKGNELKYRLRAGFKDKSKMNEDMEKAMKYREFRECYL
ncbi:protein of unknown function [Pseudodesulfovibrio profundus]|uniref:Uncharacterized protein n=1 Tax=Pseudodesulfovibrio profundus TaxID=57320 RepID=A0A2C8FDK6_9BACT|nr:DUF3310 domain-containing protein [Pseudodesulfovibrio profundus]SOB60620.1 protein of unknown function [Pseudodesulfovibrio profundus]